MIKKPVSLKRSAVINTLPFLIKLLVGIFLTPFIIGKLGKSDYGVWLLISSFAGHYGLLTIGLTSAIRHYIAIELGKERQGEINKIISTSLMFYLVFGIILIFSSFFVKDVVRNFLNINAQDFDQLFILFAVSFALSLVNSVFKSVQIAHEKFILSNALDIMILILKSSTTLVFLILGLQTLGMIYSLLLVQFIYLIINLFFHIKYFNSLRIAPANISKKTFYSLIAFGFSTFIISIGDMLRFNIDNLVTSHWIDTSSVAVYGVGTALLAYITTIIVSAVNVIAPRLSKFVGSGNKQGMLELLSRSMFVSSTLSLGALVMVYLFGKDVINYWVGPKFHDSYDIFLIITSGSILGFAQLPVISALYSLNKHKYFGYFALLEGVANVCLSIFFVRQYGIIGVAFGTLIPNLFHKVILQPTFASYLLGISFRSYITPLVFPIIVSSPYFFLKFYYYEYGELVSENLFEMLVQILVVGTSYLGLLYCVLLVFRSPFRFVMYGKRIQFLSQLYYHYKVGLKYYKEVKKAGTKSLIYAGGYPDSINLGDVALFRAYEYLFSGYNLIHYSEGKFNFLITKFLRLKKRAILGGGTLINDMSLKEATESNGLFNDFYVFGTGVAQPSFFDTLSEWHDTMDKWEPILKDSKYLGIRGPLSLSLLQKHNLKPEIFGDPVLALSNIHNQSNQIYKKKTVGINIGGSSGRVWGGENSIADSFEIFVNELKKQGFEIHWFVVWKNDLVVTKEVAERTGTTKNLHTIYEDHCEYFDKVREMSVFVGMKLHSVIMAHCEYVPSVMIEYRPKCLDYMLSVEEEDNNIRLDNLKIESLIQKIGEMESEREALSEKLFKTITHFRERQLYITSEIVKTWEKE